MMVLKRILRRRRDEAVPAVPEGKRVYAIGDIHGRADLLDQLVQKIIADDEGRPEAETILVFLGDLVDRGPDSRAVVERLLELRDGSRRTKFLLGNHDEVFLKALTGDPKAMRFLIRIGGKETIFSYGITEDEYRACDYGELVSLLGRRVPSEHRIFLESFDDCFEVGDYLFVHAGIRPGLPIDQQIVSDLRWIRREFLDCNKPHDKVVVHGHSISDSIDLRKNRIGIDTGAFATGRLSAIGLEGTERWFLEAEGPADPRWLSTPED